MLLKMAAREISTDSFAVVQSAWETCLFCVNEEMGLPLSLLGRAGPFACLLQFL
jgi:hypothetical protein